MILKDLVTIVYPKERVEIFSVDFECMEPEYIEVCGGDFRLVTKDDVVKEYLNNRVVNIYTLKERLVIVIEEKRKI